MGGRGLAWAGGGAAAAVAVTLVVAWATGDFDRARNDGAHRIGTIEREGLRLTVSLAAADGGPAAARKRGTATVAITEATTGAPVPGLRPLAWIDRADPEISCTERVKGHLGGLLSTRAEVDLNGQLLLALNEDASITVIDPRVSLKRTKLRGLISLAGRAGDWVHLPKEERLLVGLPGAGKVAVVDTAALRLRGNGEIGGRPGRLLATPDGDGAWLGDDAGGRVLLLDADGGVRARAETGPGAQHLARYRDQLWVAPGEAPWLVVLDGNAGEVARLPTPAAAAAVAAHEAAGSVYVAHVGRDEVTVWDGKTRSAAGTIPGLPGVRELRFHPGGRWLFAVSDDTLAVIDPATTSVRHRVEGLDGPDGVAFTDDYVYVREARAGNLVLLSLAELDRPRAPAPVTVPVAQRPGAPSVSIYASPLARADVPGTVIVPSPMDRALYYYREGMMAPMGSLLNNGREPLAVLALDRSLEEVAPGIHVAPLELPGPGEWEVAVLVDSPRIVACLPFELEGAEEKREPRYRLEPAFAEGTRFPAGREAAVRVRLAAATGEAVEAARLRALVFRAPGTWQWRGEAVPLGGGLHEVRFVPPAPGRYRIVASADEPRLPPGSLGVVEVVVPAEEGTR